MSTGQLKAFQEAVKADAGLQEKLKEVTDAEAVVAIAKAAGFAITADDLKKAQAEISEEELEGVAAGGTGSGNLDGMGTHIKLWDRISRESNPSRL